MKQNSKYDDKYVANKNQLNQKSQIELLDFISLCDNFHIVSETDK